MKLIIQRVTESSVLVDGQCVGHIGKGILVLVGIHKDDKEEDVDKMVDQMLHLQLWPGDEGEFSKSVIDINGGILLVSQFTLHARPNGRRPDFSHSMGPTTAGPMFDSFVSKVKANYKPELVQTGTFQAYMEVRLQNDGPIMITLNSFDK